MTSISFPPVAVPVSRLASTSRAHSRSPRYPRSALALWLGCAVAAFAGTSPELELSIGLPSTNNWTQLRLAGATNVAWTIEASEDLSAWSDIARLHALDYMPFWSDPTILFFQDAAAPDHVRRFYRASTAPVGPENVVAEHVLLQLATTKRLPPNRWSIGEGPDRRDYELETRLSYPTATAQAPAASLRDLTKEWVLSSLAVQFATPQFAINRPVDEEPLTRAVFWLVPGPMHTQKSVRVEKVMSAAPVRVETVYHYWDWTELPLYLPTAPLLRWEETRNTGLTQVRQSSRQK